jgi:hypothetical protein
MESKIILYDSDNIKIGETFHRRAKQLVRQQRAAWTDEGQKAVRFFPGMEHLKDIETDETTHPENPTPASPMDNKLLKLAKRRVVLSHVFRTMLTSYVLVNSLLIFIWLTAGRGYFWPIWPIFGWGLGLIIVHFVFKMVSSSANLFDNEVAVEYEKLRSTFGLK